MAKRAASAATPEARKATPAPPPNARRPAESAAPVRPSTPAPRSSGMQLYTVEGARKYLTAAERDAFLAVVDRADRTVQTLCMTLAYSGCRLSEALALTVD